MKIKYNIWHIDGYVGWDDYDNSSDCNICKDYIVNATFTKDDVINMFCNEHKNYRIVVTIKCFLISSGSVTYNN